MSLKISELPALARLGLLTAVAGAAIGCLELDGSALRAWRAYPPPLSRPVPTGLSWFALTAALGGEARTASDFAYIECLQYMGGPNAVDGFFGKTFALYSEVQWLDPGFRHAIIEGISALGWLYRRPDEAVRLAQTAMNSDHREARYGVYMAALAYQKHFDSNGVLAVLRPEVARPDAPEMLLRVVGNLILKQGDWRRSYAYWTWLSGRATDGETVAMAARTLRSIRRHLGLPSPGSSDRHGP